jgi:hypothetical protein
MMTFKEYRYLVEAAYAGNVGIMELIKMRKMATPEQLAQFKYHVDNQEHDKAWEIVQQVTGVKLHPSAIGTKENATTTTPR